MNPNQVSEHLSQLVAMDSSWIRKSSGSKKFFGQFSIDGFRIKKIGGYSTNNLYKPTVYGTIRPSHTGSEIQLTITLDPLNFIIVLGLNLLGIYLAAMLLSIYSIIFVVLFVLFEYLTAFAPEARSLEIELTREFAAIK